MRSIALPRMLGLAAIAACGGSGSGVDGQKLVVTLTPDEQLQLCEYFAAQAPPRTVTCSPTDIRMAGASTVPTCTSGLQMLASDHPRCAATVAQSESCLAALDRLSDLEICTTAVPMPVECAPFRTPDCIN